MLDEHSCLFYPTDNEKGIKKFYNNNTCGQLHKHFVHVTYNPSKISYTAES
jgi:hypothetical protein